MNRSRVEAATVWLTTKRGQGVLVPGGFIITAAHCIDWDSEGGMALGDYHMELFKTASGIELVGSVCAVEPVADIAVLMAPDSQELSEYHEAFEEWINAQAPVPLTGRSLAHGEPLAVQVWTHKHEWNPGTITRWGYEPVPGATIALSTELQVDGGTSGGPVVDDVGELVGVISWNSDGDRNQGAIPMVRHALPRWILDRILLAQSSDERLEAR